MQALRRRWFVLFLVAAAWAQDAPVSVTCGHTWLSVAVPAGLLGSRVAGGELTLGAGCGVTAADGDGYRLEHPLVSCGTTLELLPDSIRYSNVLHYRPSAGGPVARARPFSLPVDCYYPRTGSVSSGAIQPNWVTFGSTVAHRRRLRFALDVYDSTWSSRLRQPTYSLGEPINIEASVSTDPRLPLRVFVDECVASPSAPARLKYEVIADNGCLLDGQLGRSRFLPRRGDRFLRFQLDTFLFPNASGSQIYLRCHLKAVAEGAGGTSGKACSYDRVAAAWRSPDGADCSCCGSPAGCGGRRQRRLAGSGGLLGEASVRLGPLGLLSALPSSSPAPTGLPTALEPSTAPPRRPSVPVVRGEKRDSGPAVPVPGTTLAMVAMCSILTAVGMAGCYRSVRRYRSGHRVGDPEVTPGEPRAVAMAPTAAGGAWATPENPPAPADPAIV
ncbi:zona pellucida sperm-binding protein 3-like [Gymnogyps californianus]|uniref:zona pellucida sperm-binding protein 3-like n=1 Tax=Gymnogyps californianus TaxID=33616 RepID=UPI0021CA6F7F|nr:zona pellucida sperm-binding protein 3-like [Gymnogyps californianus]